MSTVRQHRHPATKNRQECIQQFRKQVSTHQAALTSLSETNNNIEDKVLALCLDLLVSIETFLHAWEESSFVDTTATAEPSSSITTTTTTTSENSRSSEVIIQEASDNGVEFPKAEVLDVISVIVTHVGVGRPEIRDYVLNMLMSGGFTSKTCRQILMSMLPATLSEPVANETSDQAYDEVVSGLRQVLEQDSAMIFSVLDCVSMLRLDQVFPRISFELALQTLPTIPENQFCRLFTVLIQNVCDSEEASDVVDAFRTEWRLMEDATTAEDEGAEQDGQSSQNNNIQQPTTPAEVTVTVGTEGDQRGSAIGSLDENAEPPPSAEPMLMTQALDTLLRFTCGENDPGIKLQNAYYQTLEQLKQDSEIDSVLICDIAVSILLFQKQEYAQVALAFLDTLAGQGPRIVGDLIFLMDIANDTSSSVLMNTYPSGRLRHKIVPAVISAASNLLLVPLRRSGNTTSDLSSDISSFILKLVRETSREHQDAVVTLLLVILRELAYTKASPAANQNLQQRARVMLDVLDTLVEIAKEDCTLLLGYLNVLFDLLEQEESYHWGNMVSRRVCRLISSICVAKRVEDEDGRSAAVNKVMALLQRFLFPTSKRPVEKSSGHISSICRGFALASELVSQRALGSSYLVVLQAWTERIMIPHGRRLVDPVIASWGLDFMRKLREALFSSSVGTVGQQQDEVFVTIQTILSNAGLVQMAASYPEKRKRRYQLGYSKRLDFFPLESQNRKFRPMVFSFSTFLKNSDHVTNPGGWNDLGSLVNNLVDTYLGIGRHSSKKWVPHGWLEACIELPKIDISGLKPKTKRQELAMRWLSQELSTFELEYDDKLKGDGFEKDLREMAQSVSKGSFFQVFLQSTFDLSLSLTLAISVSSAVLRNTFDHCKLATDMSNGSKGMIQHQLLKIFHMKKKCHSLKKILKAMRLPSSRGKKAVNERSKPRGSSSKIKGDNRQYQVSSRPQFSLCWEKHYRMVLLTPLTRICPYIMVQKIDNLCEQLMCVAVGNLEYSASFEVLRFCLLDSSHDKLVLDFLSPKTSTASNPLKLEFVMSLKQDILNQVVSDQFDNRLFSDAQFSSCLDFASKLSCRLNAIAEAGDTEEDTIDPNFAEDISVLSSSYFGVLNAEMTRTLRTCHSRVKAMRKAECFMSSFATALQSNDGSTPSYTIISRDPIDISMKVLLRHLQLCRDPRIVYELVDCVAVLGTFHCGFLLENSVRISWTALHTKYASLCGPFDRSRRPFAFDYALEKLSNPSNEVQIALKNLSQSIRGSSGKFAYVLRGLQRHWGLMSLSTGSFARRDNHIAIMTSLLQKYLDEIYDILLPQIQESKMQSMLDDDDDDDEEYRPPQSNRKMSIPLPQSDFPGLNDTSFPFLFDFLLQATVASMAVAAPALSEFLGESESIEARGNGPFFHFHVLAETFGFLISLFRCKHEIFPRRSLSSTLSASRQMLRVCLYQLQRCVDWRNEQPMLSMEDQEAQKFDSASIDFLKALLNSFGKNIVGELKMLCQSDHAKEHGSSVLENGSDIGEDEPKSTTNDDREKLKTNTLSAVVRKTHAALDKIASTHKLQRVNVSLDSKASKPTFNSEMTKVTPFENLRLIPSASAMTTKRKRRIQTTDATADEEPVHARKKLNSDFAGDSADDSSYIDKSDDDDSSSSDSSSAKSSSFGIDGNWNDDDDASDDEAFTLQSPLARKL